MGELTFKEAPDLSRQPSKFAFPSPQQPNVHKCGFLGKHPDEILGQRERNRQ